MSMPRGSVLVNVASSEVRKFCQCPVLVPAEAASYWKGPVGCLLAEADLIH